MDHITLHQHFYASAPHGLTGKRGLQTVAVSRSLSAESEYTTLESHCRYMTPEDFDEGERPVNWGWFYLDRQRACLHRIGYSGNDEIGRPGNFLAHSLITSVTALEAVDFDIMALMSWVRERSPYQFAHQASGICDGFVRRHDQLYEPFGKTSEALTNVPSLHIPVEEVRDMRRELDERAEAEFLPAIRQTLGEESTMRILTSVLQPTRTRTAVLLLTGDDQQGDSALAWNLCQLLFTLYPYHIRHRLTFSTFQESPLEAALIYKAGGDAHLGFQHLRLMMAPSLPYEMSQYQSSEQLQIVDIKKPTHTPSIIDSLVKKWISEAGYTRQIVTMREATSRFAWQDEVPGIQHAERLRQRSIHWKQSPPDISDYDLLHIAAQSVRRPSRELAGGCQQLVAHFAKSSSEQPGRLVQFTEDVLRIHCQTDGSLSLPTHRQCTPDELLPTLATLFELALKWNQLEAIQRLLNFIWRDDISGELQLSCLQAFPKIFSSIPSSAPLEQLLELWHTLQTTCPANHQNSTEFLDRAATILVGRITDQARNEGADTVDPRIVDLLTAAPLQSPDQFRRRLQSVVRVCRRLPAAESDRLASEFLESMYARGHLRPDSINAIAESDRRLFLASWNAWDRVSHNHPDLAACLKPILLDPQLAISYWRADADWWGPLWHAGMTSLLTQLQSNDHSAPVVAEGFVTEGEKILIKTAIDQLLALTPDNQRSVVEVHLQLNSIVRLCRAALGTSDRREIYDKSITRHMLMLCATLILRSSPQFKQAAWNWDTACSPIHAAVTWFSRDDQQAPLFFAVGHELGKLVRANLHPPPMSQLNIQEISPGLVAHIQQLLRDRPDAEQRAYWLGCCIQAALDPRGDWTSRKSEALALFLLTFPDFFKSAQRTSLSTYLESICTPAVWARIKGRLTNDCRLQAGHSDHWGLWFGRDSAKHLLVDQLANCRIDGEHESMLEKAWREIIDQARSDDTFRLCRTLRDLFLLPAHELVQPLVEHTLRIRASTAIERLLRQREQEAPDFPNEPSANIQQQVLDFCDMIRNVFPELRPALAREFWILLASCLGSDVKNERLQRIVKVFARLGEQLADTTPQSAEWWEHLFDSLKQRPVTITFHSAAARSAKRVKRPFRGLPAERLADAYIMLGESLFLSVSSRAQAHDLAMGLCQIKNQLSSAPGQKRKRFGIFRKSAAEMIREAFERSPPVKWDNSPENGELIRARAMFACCLEKSGDKRLPELLLAISQGQNGSRSVPERMAQTLAGFALFEGSGDRLMRRTQRLRDGRLRKTLQRRSGRREWKQVVQHFELALREAEVDSATAKQAADYLL